MTFEFKLKRSGSKSKRKFPRNKVTDRESLKELEYCRNNWVDDRYTYVGGNIMKFLKCHIGKPINYIYRKFKKCCKSWNTTELDNYIDKKWSQFTINNGILVYNDLIQRKQRECKYNKKAFKELHISAMIKTLWITKVPQCLGRFYVKDELHTVYLGLNIPENSTACYIAGVGRDINTTINKDNVEWEISDFCNKEYKLKMYFYFK